ncbi:MAG: hypothetical protein WD118_03030 [Phycisphaeraceae bacterium]
MPQAQPSPSDPEHSAADATARPRGADRRQSVVDGRHDTTGLERRRGPGRRRNDFVKAADEGEMSPEQFLFIKAIDAYKRVNERPYPTWTEVLEVVRKLGYRKTMPMDVTLPAVEDWSEPADAPAFVTTEPDEADAA